MWWGFSLHLIITNTMDWTRSLFFFFHTSIRVLEKVIVQQLSMIKCMWILGAYKTQGKIKVQKLWGNAFKTLHNQMTLRCQHLYLLRIKVCWIVCLFRDIIYFSSHISNLRNTITTTAIICFHSGGAVGRRFNTAIKKRFFSRAHSACGQCSSAVSRLSSSSLLKSLRATQAPRHKQDPTKA